MKNLFRILVCSMLFPAIVSAQHIEIGIFGGVSTYSGELTPATHRFSMGAFHLAGGGFFRFNHNNYFSTKLSGNYGHVSGDDALSKDEGRISRNLNFKSEILEASLTAEFNILGFDPRFLTKTFSPYVFAGLSVFRFNPQGQYEGDWVYLQRLGTEGQGLSDFPERKPYRRIELAIPFGGGLKYAVNDKLNIGLEIGLRKTMTDYLDDVSTTYVDDELLIASNGGLAGAMANQTGSPVQTGQIRGNSKTKDWYIISGLSISYNLVNKGGNGSKRRRGRLGCPTFR